MTPSCSQTNFTPTPVQGWTALSSPTCTGWVLGLGVAELSTETAGQVRATRAQCAHTLMEMEMDFDQELCRMKAATKGPSFYALSQPI